MAKTILTDIDLQQNEVQNAVIENRATAPTSPKPGQQYYDTTDNTVKTYNGTEWTSGGSGGGEGGDSIVYYNEENNYIGINDSDTSSFDTISIGGQTNSMCENTIVIGRTNIPAQAQGSLLLGNNLFTSPSNTQGIIQSVCIGNSFSLGDLIDPSFLEGTVLFRVSSVFTHTHTDFYFMGTGSLFASAYCGGEAGFGYISFDADGNIVGRGTCKLSSICTENTNSFDPANVSLE